MIGLADDKTLWGDLEDVFAAFHTYVAELHSLGLTVNPQKCVAISQDGVEHIFARCQASGILAQDGFLIAGSPVGTDQFTQDYVISEVNRIRDLVKLVSACLSEGKISYKFANQALTAVCRLVISQKISHLGRSTPPVFTRTPFNWLDRDICTLVAQVAQTNVPNDFWSTLEGSLIAERIQSRIRDGGLGIPNLSQTAPHMYVGSLSLTLHTVLTRGFLESSYVQLSAENIDEYAHMAIPHLADALQSCPEAQITHVSIFNESRPLVQRDLSIKSHNGRTKNIALRISDQQQRAWYRSLCSPHTGAFLTANWTHRGLSMDNQTWARALRLRLGMPTVDINNAKLCPHDSNVVINNTSLHSLTCQHEKLKSLRTTRHTAVKKTIVQFFKSISHNSYTVINEPNCCALPIGWTLKTDQDVSTLGRADLSIHNAEDPTDFTVLDLTIRSPASENLPRAVDMAGVAAEQGYQEKLNHYHSLYHIPNNQFLPLTLEATGRFHPSSLKWLQKQVYKMCAHECPQLARFKMKELLEKISVSLQTNCAQATSLCSVLAKDYTDAPHETS